MPPSSSSFLHFAVVSPGLESLLATELSELGLPPRVKRGGVEWRGDAESLWLVHHRSRLTESVRVRLRSFRAPRFDLLEEGLDRLPWHAYLHPGLPVRFDISCHHSRLYHSGAIEERARKAIAKRLGSCLTPRDPAVPSQEIYLRLERDEVSPSVEATGELLHRRGYRTHVGSAPLRETLAAACARLLDEAAPERSEVAVWDPCCGSGTLLCEWLLRRSEESACGERGFAFGRWPTHDPSAYASWVASLPKTSDLGSRIVLGSDRNARILRAAKHNAARARLQAACTWETGDFRDVVNQIPNGYRVLTNLPYGKRIGKGGRPATAFASLDKTLSERADLRPALVLSAGGPPKPSRCHWEKASTFSNGGIRVSAWLAK